MEPARHALGALLTEQKRYPEAMKIYERNLERYPYRNPRIICDEEGAP